MGNLPSVPNETKESVKESNQKENVVLNEEQIFSKIYEISNNLLLEYNNEFLKEDFCNKIAIIYEKKLSNFNVKILKNLYNNINSEDIDNQMMMTLQYIPKSDDEFLTDVFKDNLNEKFWKGKIEIDPQLLLNNTKDLDKSNITSSIKYSPYYINPIHVNNLLESINKINAELKNNIIENEIKTGGFNQNKIKIVNNSEIEKGQNFLNKLGIENNENHSKILLSKNTKENNNGNIKNLNEYFENNNMLNENINNYNNSNINSKNISNNLNNSKVKKQENNSEQKVFNSNNSKVKKEANNSEQKVFNSNNSKVKKEENNSEQKVFNSNNSKVKKEENNIERSPNKDKSIQKLNEVTNMLIAKKNNIPLEKNIDDKIINEYIRYTVPKYYQKPKSFCNNLEKCKLTKKDLCTAITENFIVRNNIIAAILTTVPFKNNNGLYEGGICFQKFMNLNDCTVCVPYDYRELKNRDIKSIIIKILEKADNLDEVRCKENQGYFLKLSKAEKIILGSKIVNITEKDINNYPKIKYNYYFLEFTRKLQNNYLQNLNSLITILEKMKETPIINNTTLNSISDETKKIIDNMYNTCHYYYVYGIISLISSDITEDIIKKDDLANIVSSALEK